MIEIAALCAFVAALAVVRPLGILVFLVPVFYAGQSLALAENYLEHSGAEPGARGRDAVSCYGKLYNLVWFNNGYHQEHHWRSGVHWTRVPELRDQLLPESQRAVVPAAHWLNWGRWRAGRARRSAPGTPLDRRESR